MAHDDPAAGAAEPLYRWWMDKLPAFFGAAGYTAHGADGAAATPPPPYPADHVADALRSTRGLLDALYGGFLRAVAAAPPGGEAQAFTALVQGRVAAFVEQIADLGKATSGQPDLSSLVQAGASLAAAADVLKPMTQNLERVHGGVADAFGLAPLRDLESAVREMAAAAVARRQAQAEYLQIVAGALGQGAQSLTARLSEMGRRGESVDTLLALVRLWAQTTDRAMHAAMQSPPALDASATLIRTGARLRREQHRVVAIVSEALNVPTRAELDEAFREIQQLKRELRRSRKAGATGEARAPAPKATPASAPTRALKKAPAKARSTAKKLRIA